MSAGGAGDSAPDLGRPTWRQAALVFLVAGAVYWSRLGATYFTNTEGHRVIPGWGMLDHGDWLLPKLFGQIYLRKPPGMAWAVAASGAVFGESELSARAVSALAATISALLALVFGARWFGRKYGVAAGLAMTLTPGFWAAGRSAEIEALNDLATAAAVWVILDLLIAPADRRRGAAVGLAAVAGVAIAGAALVKGPAGFAAIGMAAACGWLIGRSGTTVATPARLMAITLAVAGTIVGTLAALIARAVHFSAQEPVTQGVSEFLWSDASARGVLRVLAMPAAALASVFPASAGLLFPWGRDARSEATVTMPARSAALARATAATCLGSLIVLMLLGVHNPRYALPSLSFAPVLAAYVARGWDSGFFPTRRRIASWCFLRHRAGWPVVLLIGAALYIACVEPAQRASSGRKAGVALAAALPDHAFVWADALVEARPEVLLYAQRAAAREQKELRFVWVPSMADPRALSLPRLNDYIILRTDPEGNEAALYEQQGYFDRLELITSGRVSKYSFNVYQMVRPKGQ